MKGRITVLNALRGFACLIILLSHTINVFPIIGRGGATFFLVLSGFLMTYNYLPRFQEFQNSLKGLNSIKENVCFATQRMKKIYSLNILLMTAGMILQIYSYFVRRLLPHDALSDLCFRLFSNVFLLQAWIPNSEKVVLNGPSWYLSVAFFCYFMFFYIVIVLRKIKKKISLQKCLLFVVFLQILYTILVSVYCEEMLIYLIYYFPLYRISDFCIGIILGWLYIEKNEQWSSSWREAIALITVLISQVLYVMVRDSWYAIDLLFIPSSIMLCVFFAEGRGLFSKAFEAKWIQWIGNRSSYIYIIHMMIFQYLNFFKLPYLFWLFGGIAITFLSAEMLARLQYRTAKREVKQ